MQQQQTHLHSAQKPCPLKPWVLKLCQMWNSDLPRMQNTVNPGSNTPPSLLPPQTWTPSWTDWVSWYTLAESYPPSSPARWVSSMLRPTGTCPRSYESLTRRDKCSRTSIHCSAHWKFPSSSYISPPPSLSYIIPFSLSLCYKKINNVLYYWWPCMRKAWYIRARVS